MLVAREFNRNVFDCENS